MHRESGEWGPRFGWWLLTLAFVGLNVLMGLCIRDLVHEGSLAAESVTWPSAPGTILSASVGVSHGHRGATSYRADIRYRFAVGERMFEGRRLAFDGCGSERACQALVDAHPAGSPAEIHYRPASPEENVVIPGGGTDDVLVLVFGLGEVLLALITLAMVTLGVILLLPLPMLPLALQRRQQARAEK